MASTSKSDQSTINKQALLFNALKKEEWEKVVKIFEDHSEVHASKIDNDPYESNTALHWAIIHKADELKVVAKLVFAIKRAHSSNANMALEILKSKNKRGDTPLHCAATRGSKLICTTIIENDPSLPPADLSYKSLVNEPNNDEETPLFLAALNGDEDTFTYLLSICRVSNNSKLPPPIWQRKDRDTILHWTIRRKYFDLSYKIIQNFKEESIGSYYNIHGKLPLDEIVSIPSAFKTGFFLEFFDGELRYKYKLSELILEELVKQDPWYKERDHAQEVQNVDNEEYYHERDKQVQGGRLKINTPLLIAAENGLVRAVRKILEDIPVSIYDKSLIEKRNIVHVAIKERQSHVLEEVKKLRPKHWVVLREKLDEEGNNALHLAAKQSEYIASGIHSGSIMQMQWEILWFEYVKDCMPSYFISQVNKNYKTPGEIFTDEHKNLINDCDNTLKDMCGSYMVASTLVSGSTFSSCIQDIHKYGLTFSIAVLISFLCSISSLTTFLAIYLSRMQQPKGFRRSLPLKLCLGIVSFLASLVSMLVSFYAALSHDFHAKEKSKPMIISYGVVLSPVALLYLFTQLPLYWHLFLFSFKKVPKPRNVEENNISRFFQDSRMAH